MLTPIRTRIILGGGLKVIPAMKSFTAGPNWKMYEFTFQSFGLEGHDITGIFIGGSLEQGPFSIQIDNVRLK